MNLVSIYAKRLAVGVMIALGIGLVVVVTCNVVLTMADGNQVTTIWNDAMLARILIAGCPYFVLATFGSHTRTTWIAALVLTAAFWSYYVWTVIHYDGIGANIGLGLVMTASPVAVLAGSLLAHFTLRRPKPAVH